MKNKNFEYTHHNLGGNNTEPLNSENHIHIYINHITCIFVAYDWLYLLLYDVLSLILTKKWNRFQILDKNVVIFLTIWPLDFKLWVFEY